MAKKKTYVEKLSQEDVEKILEVIGLEINNERYDRYGEELAPMIRGADEEGENHINVFCVNRKEQKLSSEIAKYMYENSPAFKAFYDNILTASVVVSSFGGFGGFGGWGSNPYSSSNVILDFTDFTLTEILSLKEEKDWLEYNSMMTEVYNKYMEEKFGKEYTQDRDKYIEKLRAKFEAEEKNKKAEENAEETAKEKE